MEHLSRNDIEGIAKRVIAAYGALPELQGEPLCKVNPELLVGKVLGLRTGYEHLSHAGDILGLTAFEEMGVEVYDDAGGASVYMLDGKTILVEKDLRDCTDQRGRCNFSVMHEAAHQIIRMLFPHSYGVHKSKTLHYYKSSNEGRSSVSNWEEWQANALASALLLPARILKEGMSRFGLKEKIKILNRIYFPIQFEHFANLAAFLGCSKQALAIRMKHLGLLEKDYLRNPHDWINSQCV